MMTQTGEEVYPHWPSRVKLLSNSHVWRMVFWGFLATGVIAGLIVTMVGGFLFLMTAFLMTGLVVDLFGGFHVTFLITSHGIRSIRGKGANAISTAAVLGGAIAGNMAAVGSGLLAEAERNVFIAYPDVRTVSVRSGGGYILVKGGF